MVLQFICPRHRAWLADNPREVAPLWSRAMHRAQQLISKGDWSRALPQAGCALDAARLMVSDARYCDRTWVSRHRASEALVQLVTAWLGSPVATTGRPVAATLH